jgi:hypothetical protein
MEAAVSRKAEDAVRLLQEHFDKTGRLVRKQLAEMISSAKNAAGNIAEITA